MTIRTKIWLIAATVAVAVGFLSWLRMTVARQQIITDARTSAEEIAKDIADDLKSVPPDADDRDLELLGYLSRHSRIGVSTLRLSRGVHALEPHRCATRHRPGSHASRRSRASRSG